ncbi:MAG TPA: rhodanese-like domain-containing protein [Verrucomicrobiota bacterium]|jgi:rhodanese-related sulfurtransferase|nr:rhodanese-like domain-containing protein [Verrucomicrobiota bacterium]HQL78535.1 rhodanese-like domain-containing protein [Verrucomicrobiota bacterium]
MNIVTWIVIVGAVAAFLLMKRLTRTSPAVARQWLDKGALVIDVRSEAEFQERHLPDAINIPLGRLGDEIARHAPNKQQPLLLHCRSGARSGIGTRALKKLGYSHVLNLGSYGSAENIVRAANNEAGAAGGRTDPGRATP